ncbi:MAG: PLP-dependent aminotransferase family protein [Pseudomonadota bacterium]
MHQTNLEPALLAISLSRQSAEPLQAQLAHALRTLIDRGIAPPGARLPASRAFAAELGVSRATAVAALDQLRAEGYLASRRGAGVFVAHNLPDAPDAAPRPPSPAPPRAGALAPPPPTAPRPFHPFEGGADETLFPYRDWARLLEKSWRAPDRAALCAPDPFGWPPLRRAIAAHLAAWRGVEDDGAPIDPARVIITAGAADAASLIARAAFAPGGAIALENPGYRPTERRFQAAGLAIVDAPVDANGLDPERLPTADGCFLTPSRHYPLGVALPLARRRALLEWAGAAAAPRALIEDDYDSEYRYEGRPIPALAALDDGAHVLYLGSFSKVFSPTLRLGFLVAPARLIGAFADAIAADGPQASLIPQPALAAFMESGGYAAHVRRMRRRYGERRKALIAALQVTIGDDLKPAPEPSGMHLVCRFSPALAARLTDAEASARAAEAGVSARALSSFYRDPGAAPFQALILGFSAFETAALEAATHRLALALRP